MINKNSSGFAIR